jgi:hypothetical protein
MIGRLLELSRHLAVNVVAYDYVRAGLYGRSSAWAEVMLKDGRHRFMLACGC